MNENISVVNNTEQALRIIYDSEFGGQPIGDNDLHSVYDSIVVSPLECKILAWMFFNRDSKYNMEEAGSLFGMDELQFQNMLQAMTYERLLEEKNGIIDVPQDINIMKESEHTYHYDTAKELFEDLRNMLRGTAWDEDEKPNCVAWITRVAFQNAENTFCKGYRELSEVLSYEERWALLELVSQFASEGIEPLGMDSLVGTRLTTTKKGLNGLVGRGLAVVVIGEDSENDDCNEDKKGAYRLSVKACKAMFFGLKDCINYCALSRQGQIINNEDIIHKRLFFNEEDLYRIDSLRHAVDKQQYSRIMERMANKGRRKALVCLLFGKPGTGKTELCKQLAKESGRDILLVDPSKLYGRYWGVSEKRFRELFDNYRYLVAISPDAPIMVFNEADGILGKRTSEQTSMGKAENTIQNIILQALEDFEGIFIATTNLIQNLDDAFDRRFLLKIEYNLPNANTRKKIWKAHIPELSDAEAEELAEAFNLSGGYMDNVATKRDLHEVLNGETPSKKLMWAFCQEEMVIMKSEQASGRSIKGYAKYINN